MTTAALESPDRDRAHLGRPRRRDVNSRTLSGNRRPRLLGNASAEIREWRLALAAKGTDFGHEGTPTEAEGSNRGRQALIDAIW